MTSAPTSCLNCDAPIQENQRFCPHCGQRVVHKLTLYALYANTITNYLSLDGKLYKAIGPLILNPGKLTTIFLSGKRQKYIHPGKLYITCSIIFLFMVSILLKSKIGKPITIDQPDKDIQLNEHALSDSLNPMIDRLQMPVIGDSTSTDSVSPPPHEGIDIAISIDLDREMQIIDSLKNTGATMDEKLSAVGINEQSSAIQRILYRQSIKIYETSGQNLVSLILKLTPYAFFLCLPILALLFKLFFWKKGNLASHMVFSLHLVSAIFAISSLVLLSSFLWDLPETIWLYLLVVVWLYFTIATIRVYGKHYVWTIIKSNIALALYSIIFIPVVSLTLIILAFFLY